MSTMVLTNSSGMSFNVVFLVMLHCSSPVSLPNAFVLGSVRCSTFSVSIVCVVMFSVPIDGYFARGCCYLISFVLSVLSLPVLFGWWTYLFRTLLSFAPCSLCVAPRSLLVVVLWVYATFSSKLSASLLMFFSRVDRLFRNSTCCHLSI